MGGNGDRLADFVSEVLEADEDGGDIVEGLVSEGALQDHFHGLSTDLVNSATSPLFCCLPHV